MKTLTKYLTLVGCTVGLMACGSVPSHDVDGPSDLKNYDRSLYERTSSANSSLYQRLGGRDIIERFVDVGVERVLINERIGFMFENTDVPNLKFQLTEQICQLAGGPCIYEGMDMESAHFDLDIRAADFNALVEDFQYAMRATGVPYGLENQVLALLAPMKPAILHK
jgi:hemoglobin